MRTEGPAARPWLGRPIVALALALAAALSLAGDPLRHVPAFVAGCLAWGLVAMRARPLTLTGALAAAALARALLLALPPSLSDDLYRYVWEGRVWAAGFSPFAHAPADPALAPLRDELWSKVNHREVSSIYPPFAQALFYLLHPGGPFAFRLGAVLADLATVALLHRRSAIAGTRWALLPLPALEAAVSGHLEAWGVLALVAALGGRPLAAWIGAMIKLLPGVLLLRRPWWEWPLWIGLSLAAFAPLFGPGLGRGMGTYAEKWSFNGSMFPVFRWVAGEEVARIACAATAAVLFGIILLRSRDPARIGLWACGLFVLFSPTVHPWYVLWPLAAGLWSGSTAWAWLAVLVPLAYVVLDGFDPGSSRWSEPPWPRLVIYPTFFFLLCREILFRWTRPGPASVA